MKVLKEHILCDDSFNSIETQRSDFLHPKIESEMVLLP